MPDREIGAIDMDLVQRVLHKGNCPIHYWVSNRGNGGWLVFMHGAGADHEMFMEQLEAVRHLYRLLLWDARGHGCSRPMGERFSIPLIVEDLAAIMDRERIEKAVLIGHSMGGNAAQAFVVQFPDRVEKLVLIDCTCNSMTMSGLEKFLLAMAPPLVRMVTWKRLVRSCAKASSLRPAAQHYLTRAFQQVGKQDFVAILLATVSCVHDKPHYRIDKPILLVCGEEDPIGRIQKSAPVWSMNEPGCTFVKIPQARHCPHLDQPAAFNRALISFLNGLS